MTLADVVRQQSSGAIDSVFAIGGLSSRTVAVDCFGAVVVSSMAGLMPADDELVELLAAGDEATALARAETLACEPATLGQLLYSSSMTALSLSIRRTAPTADWAGASIPLNAAERHRAARGGSQGAGVAGW